MLRLLFKVVSLWMVVASLFCVVAGRPIVMRETNADRMARGLPPARPVFGRNVPGGATPVNAAKRTNPSPSPYPPGVGHRGKIEVRGLDGHVYGRVRNWDSGFIGGVNFGGISQDLEVKLLKTPGPGHLYDIVATNPTFPAPHFVGAGGGNALGTGRKDVSALSTVYQSPPGSGPANQNGVVGQSAIWQINPQTKELKAYYVNPDGGTPTTTIGFNLRSNTLFFTGDLAYWNTDNNTPASEVKFFLV